MLPKPLTEDICSLRADVERLAFSVMWEMTPDARILSTRFTKSVIKYVPTATTNAPPLLYHALCHRYWLLLACARLIGPIHVQGKADKRV